MPVITFSERDLLRGKVVTPAWYRVEILDVQEKPSSDGQSMNTWIKGRILFNADNGSKEFEGVPTPFLWLFNSKGAFAAVGFVNSLTGSEVTPGSRFNLNKETLVGKQLDAFIGNGIYNNQTVNTMTGQYRQPRQAQEAVTA